MSERPRWLTEAARSGPAVDDAPESRPGTGSAGRDPRPARRLGRLRRAAARRSDARRSGGGRSGGRGSGGDPGRVRFERRAATVRRRPRLLLAIGAGALVLVLAAAWVVGFSSLLAAKTVTVTGLADPGEQAAVVAAAAVPLGTPLARVDTGGASERVAQIPTVASVTVSRSWPSTVVVSVARKVPVLAVKNPQGQLQVVDATGVPFETVATLPAGVAQVNAASDAPDPEGIRTAISVLQLLSPERRAQVSAVTITSADLVTLQLGPVSVVWGGQADGPTKLAVLEALLKTNPAVIDVSAPDTPVTR
jgi:cell division protein FtsQ